MLKNPEKHAKNQIQHFTAKLQSGDLRAWTLLIAPFLLWAVIEVPRWTASRVTREPDKYFEVENKARSTLLQGIGGGLLFVTAYVALKNLKLAEEKNKTDLFVKSAEMLANKDKPDIRLAGIYALKSLASDSAQMRWVIVELLCAFVRREVPIEKALFTNAEHCLEDIQAALDVIGMWQVPTGFTKNLSATNLKNACFKEAKLKGAIFDQAKLQGCSFVSSDLTAASFVGSDLSGAKFNDTTLVESVFMGANLNNAGFNNSNLRKADFRVSTINGTLFIHAKNLDSKQIKEAKHWGQALYDENFAEKELGLARHKQKKMLAERGSLKEIFETNPLLKDLTLPEEVRHRKNKE